MNSVHNLQPFTHPLFSLLLTHPSYLPQEGTTHLQYPSPPSTGSHPKKSIPLPGIYPASPSIFGGLLDSPLLIQHRLLHDHHTPISPPATLPTTTLALPHTDIIPDFHPTPHDEPSAKTRDGLASLQLLSPLSPVWTSTGIQDVPLPEPSALLSGPHGSLPSFRKRERMHDDDDNHPWPRRHSFPRSPPQSPQPYCPALPLCDGQNDALSHMDIDTPQSAPVQWPPCALSTPPLSPELTVLSISQDVPTPQPTRPFLHLLQIPKPYQARTGPNHFNNETENVSFPDVMDIDEQDSTSFLPPSPPLESQPLAELGPLDLSLTPPAQSPSPSRRLFAPLPELDLGEEPLFTQPSPFSPPQQLLSLPGADTDEDLIPTDLSSPNFIPEPLSSASTSTSTATSTPSSSPSFLSADPLAVPPRTSSLLLIDDPNDIPTPRSPSPENYDLDIPLLLEEATSDDPDLKKLCELRRKAIAAERAARQLEAQTLLAQGAGASASGGAGIAAGAGGAAGAAVALHARAEARRVRKREKERSREIGALLRLKLGGDAMGKGKSQQGKEKEGEQVVSARDGSVGSTSKRMINSLSQLVARMMFRRNETSRPLANRKSAGRRDYVKSSLSQSVVADEDEDDDGNDHVMLGMDG